MRLKHDGKHRAVSVRNGGKRTFFGVEMQLRETLLVSRSAIRRKSRREDPEEKKRKEKKRRSEEKRP